MANIKQTTHREPVGPTPATIKRLFAQSGNRCAFPRCTANIVQDGTVVGDVCHIRARMTGGPRYDAQQSPEERHGYDNLILLCANHHTVVDDDTEAYTVDRLVKMKGDHEQRAASMTTESTDRGAQLLIDQFVMAINQSGGIAAHTVNINVGPGGQYPSAAVAGSPSEQGRKAYIEDLKRTATQVLHSQMTPEGRLALRHLMHREEVEVGRTFLTDIPQERLHAQLRIAMQAGIVQHREVRHGMLRTYWIINPQFRPILEEVLYNDPET